MKPILSTLALLLLCCQIFGQQNGDSTPRVVFKRFVAPAYPSMAIIAKIAGDVSVNISVHADGTLESVTPISGDRILTQAAVESAKQSQFQCRNCNGLTEKSLIYTFQLPAVRPDPDPCCCSSGSNTSSQTTPPVSEFEGHITITAGPLCVCPDACTAARAKALSKYRSAKCLYLWKCGIRQVAIM